MIQNIKLSKQTFQQKKFSMQETQRYPKQHGLRQNSINSSVADSLIFDMSSRLDIENENYSHKSRFGQGGRDNSVDRVQMNQRQGSESQLASHSSKGQIHHFKTRRPNYSLGYSASGKIVPRKFAHPTAMHHLSATLNDEDPLTKRGNNSTALDSSKPHSQTFKGSQRSSVFMTANDKKKAIM